MAGSRSIWRHARIAVICLLLGVVLTVGVSWTLTLLWDDNGPISVVEGEAWPAFARPEPDEPPDLIAFRGRRLGVRADSWREMERISSLHIERFQAGLPLRALAWGSVTDAEGWEHASGRLWIPAWFARTRSGAGYETVESFGRSMDWVALPIMPRWPGFAVDVGTYALLVWIALFGPGALRRWRRLRLGRCERCGYDLAGLEACPECGERERARSGAARQIRASAAGR